MIIRCTQYSVLGTCSSCKNIVQCLNIQNFIFQVHFAEESNLTEVFVETDWAEEYQEARKGQWYQYGLDRERFQKRISEVEKILAPVLSAEHRLKVYERLTER